MKTRLTIVLAILLVLSFGSIAEAGKLLGAKRTVDIALDGYCDGMHLVINLNTGVVTGNQTGCMSDLVWGTVGALFGAKQKGICVSAQTDAWSWHMVIRDNGTWTYYMEDGTVYNSGTYTKGLPTMAADSFSSMTSSGE